MKTPKARRTIGEIRLSPFFGHRDRKRHAGMVFGSAFAVSMRRSRPRFSVGSVPFVLMLTTGCGAAGTSPTELSGLCRIYASSVTATTTSSTSAGMPPFVDTKNIAISYNTATNQLLETGTGTTNNGRCQTNFSWVTDYRSLADFLYEVSVSSPQTRWTTQSGMATYSGPANPFVCEATYAMAVTNSYDGQGKLASSISTGTGVFFSVVAFIPGTHPYTDWDGLGRPTAYAPFDFSPLARDHISYDDSARTRTTVSGGGGLTVTTVDSFDANGNLVRNRRVAHTSVPPSLAGPGYSFDDTLDTTFAIHATNRACR